MKDLPLVKGTLPWQAAYRLIRNPIPFLEEQMERMGDIYRIDAPIPFVLITGPDMMRHVLHKHMEHYRKGPAYKKGFSLMMGDGILNSEGEKWKKQRQMIQPSFDPGRLVMLSEQMHAHATPLVERWRNLSGQDHLSGIYEEMLQYATEVMGEVLMGKAYSEIYREKLVPLLMRQYRIVLKHNRSFFKWPLWVPTCRNRDYFRTKKKLHSLVRQMIGEMEPGNNESMLCQMMNARDADGNPMSEPELVDEFLTLFVTGFETTGSALSWVIVLLSMYPDEQEKVFREISEINEGTGLLGESLLQCPYLNAVVREALRLYPPVWLIARESVRQDEIRGMRIPAKAHILLCTYIAHRDPRYWDEPGTFRPERFLGSGNHPAYLPFGAGPRTCIGKNFSHMELLTMLYSICREFRFQWPTGATLKIIPKTTLQPRIHPGIRIEKR